MQHGVLAHIEQASKGRNRTVPFFLRKGFDMTTHWFIQERKQTA